MKTSFKSKMGGASALTLTLSPGEREQPLRASGNSDAGRAAGSRGYVKAQGTFLPLRSIGWRGEGRGEVRSAFHVVLGAWKFGASLVLGYWCLVLLFGQTAQAQPYSIDWYKIAGGGGTSTGGTYSVSGTIGQHDASGAMTGGGYSLTGGFWALYALQTPGAPTLNISHSGNIVTVYWQNVAGWNLIQSGNLITPTVSWTASSSPTLTGGTNYLNLVNPAGNLFFRLKNP